MPPLHATSMLALSGLLLLAAQTEGCDVEDDSGLSIRDCTWRVDHPHRTRDGGSGEFVIHAKVSLRCPKPGLEVHLSGEIQRRDKDLFSADDWETRISDDYDISAEESSRGVVRYVPHRDNDLDSKLRCEASASYRAVVRLSGGGDTDERTSAEHEVEC